MPCEYACAKGHDPVGLADCCHTCAYFVGGTCLTPRSGSFFPRVLWRMYREA